MDGATAPLPKEPNEDESTISQTHHQQHHISAHTQEFPSRPYLETQIWDGLGLDSVEVHITCRSPRGGRRQGVEHAVDGTAGSRVGVPRGPEEEDSLPAGGRGVGQVRCGHGCEGQRGQSPGARRY